jgi:hypothetical protein
LGDGFKMGNGVRNIFKTVYGLSAPGTKGDEATGMRPMDGGIWNGIEWTSGPRGTPMAKDRRSFSFHSTDCDHSLCTRHRFVGVYALELVC